MSLINDALKRAKQAQQKVPGMSVPQVQYQLVQPRQSTRRRGNGFFLTVVIVVGLTSSFLLWQWYKEHGYKLPHEAKAREIVPANPVPQKSAPPSAPSVTARAPSAPTPSVAARTPSAPAPL